MTPIQFPEANRMFGPPPDLDESQCGRLFGFVGEINRGNLDGSIVTVTAWEPSPEERQAIADGRPIFVSFVGGLPPHFLTTSFQEAVNLT